jgi:hypothetical protein
MNGHLPAPRESMATRARLRQEIAQSRARVGRALAETQERLRPASLWQQSKDAMRQAAVNKVKHVTHTVSEVAHRAATRTQSSMSRGATHVRRDPLLPALLAAGLSWGARRWRRAPARRQTAPKGMWIPVGIAVGVLGYSLLSGARRDREIGSSRSAIARMSTTPQGSLRKRTRILDVIAWGLGVVAGVWSRSHAREARLINGIRGAFLRRAPVGAPISLPPA